MRSKEEAHDYRYFPDPDLLPLAISEEWIERVRGEMPELPGAMRERFTRQYSASPAEAAALTATRETARYFEAAVGAVGDPAAARVCANWIAGELAARLNRENLDIGAAPVSPEQLAGLVRRIADGTISGKIAKEVFDALWNGEAADADACIEAKGLRQISDSGAIGRFVDEVIAADPESVAEFRAGRQKALNALVGRVMKVSGGKANPQQVAELLRARLAG